MAGCNLIEAESGGGGRKRGKRKRKNSVLRERWKSQGGKEWGIQEKGKELSGRGESKVR